MTGCSRSLSLPRGSNRATSRLRSSTSSESLNSTLPTALSFPVDGDGDGSGPRELGDIIICPQMTEDLREAIVHGALHLVGMDHETDDGEMLALQGEICSW